MTGEYKDKDNLTCIINLLLECICMLKTGCTCNIVIGELKDEENCDEESLRRNFYNCLVHMMLFY